MLMQTGTSTLFPLTVAGENDKVRIVHARVGSRLAKRLIMMGILEDTEWEVLQCKPNGAVVIRRESTRLTLGADIAEKIMGIMVWPKRVDTRQS